MTRRLPMVPAVMALVAGLLAPLWGETVFERDKRLAEERERNAPNVHNPGFRDTTEGPGTRWARERAEAAAAEEEARRQAASSMPPPPARDTQKEEATNKLLREAFKSAAERSEAEREARIEANRQRLRQRMERLQHVSPGDPIPPDEDGDRLAEVAGWYENGHNVSDDPVMAAANNSEQARRDQGTRFRLLAAGAGHTPSIVRVVQAVTADRADLRALADHWIGAMGWFEPAPPVSAGTASIRTWAARLRQQDEALGRFAEAFTEDYADGIAPSEATLQRWSQVVLDGGALAKVAQTRLHERRADQRRWLSRGQINSTWLLYLADDFSDAAYQENKQEQQNGWGEARYIAHAYARDAMGSRDPALAALPPGPARAAACRAQAVAWFTAAAEGGDPLSSLLLGQMALDEQHPDHRLDLGDRILGQSFFLRPLQRALLNELAVRAGRNEVPATVAQIQILMALGDRRLASPRDNATAARSLADLANLLNEGSTAWWPRIESARQSHGDVVDASYAWYLYQREGSSAKVMAVYRQLAERPGLHQGRACAVLARFAGADASERDRWTRLAAVHGHGPSQRSEARRKAAEDAENARRAAEKAAVEAEKAAEAKRRQDEVARQQQVVDSVAALAAGDVSSANQAELKAALAGGPASEREDIDRVVPALLAVGQPWRTDGPDPRSTARDPSWLPTAVRQRIAERLFLDGDAAAPAWPLAECEARFQASGRWLNNEVDPVSLALRGRILARFATWGWQPAEDALRRWYSERYPELRTDYPSTGAMPLPEAAALAAVYTAGASAVKTLGGFYADRWDAAAQPEAFAAVAAALRAGDHEVEDAVAQRLFRAGNITTIGAPDHLRSPEYKTIGVEVLTAALLDRAEQRFERLKGDPAMAPELWHARLYARLTAAIYAAPATAAAHLAEARQLLDATIPAGIDDRAGPWLAARRRYFAHVLAARGDFAGAAAQFTQANDIDGLAQAVLAMPESPGRTVHLEQVQREAAKLLPDDPDQRCRSATFYALAQHAEAQARRLGTGEAWATVARLYDQGGSLTFQLEWYNARCSWRALTLMTEGHLPKPPVDRIWWIRRFFDVPMTYDPPKDRPDYTVVLTPAYEETARLKPDPDVLFARIVALEMLHNAERPASTAALARWQAALDPCALALRPRAELEAAAPHTAAAALALVLKQWLPDRTGEDALELNDDAKAKIAAWLAQADSLPETPALRAAWSP